MISQNYYLHEVDSQSTFRPFSVFLMFSFILDNYLTVYFYICCVIYNCLSLSAEDKVQFFLSFMCNGSKAAPNTFFCKTAVKLQPYISWLIRVLIQVLNVDIQQTCMDDLMYSILILMFVGTLYALTFCIFQYIPFLKSTYQSYEQHGTRKGNLLRYYSENNKLQRSLCQMIDSSKPHFKYLTPFTSPYGIICACAGTAKLSVGIHPAVVGRILPLQ